MMKFLENTFKLLAEHLFRGRIVDTNRRYHFKGGVDMGRVYLCIDLKSFYASVECVARGYDKESFQSKIDLLMNHFVDMAVQGYGWISTVV